MIKSYYDNLQEDRPFPGIEVFNHIEKENLSHYKLSAKHFRTLKVPTYAIGVLVRKLNNQSFRVTRLFYHSTNGEPYCWQQPYKAEDKRGTKNG